MDKVMEIFKELKSNLENTGLVIDDEQGVSNLIILSLYEAFGEGEEQGKKSSRIKTIEELESKIKEMK